MTTNPFTPGFGETPTILAGRSQLLESLRRAFQSETRRPELTLLISGARGTGKTTMLLEAANLAEQNGWITVGTTALPGMLSDLEIGANRKSEHLVGKELGGHVSGIGIPQILEVQIGRENAPASNWRWRMDTLLSQLQEKGTGLLITVDELDPNLDELRELVAVYQHFVGEGRKVALMLAGLPYRVSSLLNDKTVSFLRRARQVSLGPIPDYEVESAMLRMIETSGRSVERRDLHDAITAIGGFPFLMQLIGFQAWDANPAEERISANDIQLGIDLAMMEMNERVLGATYRELSNNDIALARAMLEDHEPSRVSDLAERLKWSPAQVGQYVSRLMNAGIVGRPARGQVAFELPFFKEYLEHNE